MISVILQRKNESSTQASGRGWEEVWEQTGHLMSTVNMLLQAGPLMASTRQSIACSWRSSSSPNSVSLLHRESPQGRNTGCDIIYSMKSSHKALLELPDTHICDIDSPRLCTFEPNILFEIWTVLATGTHLVIGHLATKATLKM